MVIPKLDITQHIPDVVNGHETQIREIARSILTALRTYPYYIVVHGYPPDQNRDHLLNLAKAIRLEGNNQAAVGVSQQSQEKISFTKVRINPERANAKKRVTQYSRTHRPLAPHTDSSYMVRPHEVVAFQCIIPAQSGGESILIPIQDVLPQLDAETLQCLQEPVYLFGSKCYPILTGILPDKSEQQAIGIRYYRAQLDHIKETARSPLSPDHLNALNVLDTLLGKTEPFPQFHLEAGEIAFMHNHKVLHGRGGFSPDSDRLLYRIRLHIDSLAPMHQPPTEAKLTALTATDNTLDMPWMTTLPTSASSQNPAPLFSPLMNPLTINSGLNTHSTPPTNPVSRSPHLFYPIPPQQPISDESNFISPVDKNSQTVGISASVALAQAQAHLVQANHLKNLNRPDEVLHHCLQASQLVPENLKILNACGKLLLRIGKFAEAIPIFRRCLEINPADFDSGLALSSLLDRVRAKEAAQATLKQVFHYHPYTWKTSHDPQKKTILRIRGMDGSAYQIIRSSNGFFKYILKGGHFSIRALIEKQDYNLVVLNLLANNIDTCTDIPPADLMINTLACPDLKRLSLLTAARFIDRYPHIPVINHPRQVLATTRERNALRLNLVSGVTFPKTERLFWHGSSLDELIQEIFGLGFQFPII
ncbi:MAG: TauD/TfdA family dioxygenase, partial [Leptolyngbyaceae cyanobacterium]